MDEDATLYGGRPRGLRDIMLDGDRARRGELGPEFLANVCCGQTAGWTQMPLGMEIGLDQGGDFVSDEDPATPRKKGHTPHPMLAHVYCGQTAGWIKMPLGTEVNLDPGDVVLDGVAAPPERAHPQFSVHVYCGQMAAWIKMPLCTEVGPRFTRHC